MPKGSPAPVAWVPKRIVSGSTRTSDELSALAQMDLAALEQAANDCKACGLCAERQGALVGMGHSPAALMVVGDAPTDADDRNQSPFSGPEGQLLDNMLRAIGASRQTGRAPTQASKDPAVTTPAAVFVTHALKCRPPTGRAAGADEVAQCQPILQRQVALVQPQVILAMGRLAVQSLLGSTEPLGKLRSRVHHAWGARVIVTYELSYLLRNRANKRQAWQDLCLALDTLGESVAPNTPTATESAP